MPVSGGLEPATAIAGSVVPVASLDPRMGANMEMLGSGHAVIARKETGVALRWGPVGHPDWPWGGGDPGSRRSWIGSGASCASRAPWVEVGAEEERDEWRELRAEARSLGGQAADGLSSRGKRLPNSGGLWGAAGRRRLSLVVELSYGPFSSRSQGSGI
ncbi:hypothetical protein NDU88_006121 [Pleurodeles waltl]|uniref:Uncharacterized protein n=1 Tax=Pleurodeles waltl TaxID=8319 RepID=A0AAV7TD94_PLEWA|nr:hypothetical protein NDU88_006121 [Pleurodeles waltl]